MTSTNHSGFTACLQEKHIRLGQGRDSRSSCKLSVFSGTVLHNFIGSYRKAYQTSNNQRTQNFVDHRDHRSGGEPFRTASLLQRSPWPLTHSCQN